MKIFELLNCCNPSEMKVHFAVANTSDPFELFKADQGLFTQYQEIQTKRNFSRKYILSLVQMENKSEWLFAGIYEVLDVPIMKDSRYIYKTNLTELYGDLIGRLILGYKKTFRNSYPNAETIIDIDVSSIRAERLSVDDFKSFHNTNLNRIELETIFKHQAKGWKAALSSVAAIYLITDYQNNKLYVGSAYKITPESAGSLWNRWKSYYRTYHGGNKLLKNLYGEKGKGGFASFQYSILETFDIDISQSEIIARESEWKRRLRTRETGYNDN